MYIPGYALVAFVAFLQRRRIRPVSGGNATAAAV
jgi:hypothetical protein